MISSQVSSWFTCIEIRRAIVFPDKGFGNDESIDLRQQWIVVAAIDCHHRYPRPRGNDRRIHRVLPEKRIQAF